MNHAPRKSLDAILAEAAPLPRQRRRRDRPGLRPWGRVGRCGRRGSRPPRRRTARVDRFVQRGRSGRRARSRCGTGSERERHERRITPAAGTRSTRTSKWSRSRTRRNDLDSLARTVDTLRDIGIKYRLDPILEPIGFGFAASLGRYIETRRRFPDAELMMGVGNLTELTDADSAGRERAARGVLPGTRRAQRADDGSDQLGPLVGEGVRPRATTGVPRGPREGAAEAARTEPRPAPRPEAVRAGRGGIARTRPRA